MFVSVTRCLSPRRVRRLASSLFVGAAGLLLGGVSHANLVPNGCADVIHLPPQVVVLYWSLTGNDDFNKLAAFDAQFLNASTPPGSGSGLIGTAYNEVLTQYWLGTGNRCSGELPTVNGVTASTPSPVIITNPPPPAAGVSVATAAGMEDSLMAQIAPKYVDDTVFVLQYGPNTTWPGGGDCAYHDYTSSLAPYISLPYQTSVDAGCGGPTIYDVQASNMNHEYAETITDPTGGGWLDPSGGEIGDICDTTALQEVQVLPTGSAPASHVGIQALWSNRANGGNGACVFAQMMHSMNYYLGGDGQIWMQSDSTNSATAVGSPSYGATFKTAPSVTTWGPGREDLFAFDSKSHLGHLYVQAGVGVGSDDWGAAPSGTTFQNRPAVASWGNGRLDIFANVKGSTQQTMHRSWDNGSQASWKALPAASVTFVSAPAAVAEVYKSLDVVALGSDGNVYHSSSTNGTQYSAWASLGKPGGGVTLTGDPAIGSWGPGRFDVVFVNSSGNLSHYWSDSNAGTHGWNAWNAPSTHFHGSPSVTTMGDRRLKISAVTTSGSLVEYLYDFGTFTNTQLPAIFAPVGNATAITYNGM